MNWFCLAIKAAQHKKIIEKLTALGVEPYYPQRVVWRKRRAGPRQRRSVALIPSYLFVGCDLEVISARSILSINGIVAFLGSGGDPEPVRLNDLARIRQCEDRGDYDETLLRIDQMLVGKTFPINDGPFESMMATVTSVVNGRARVDVELFGKATPMTIDIDSLVKPI